MNIKNTEFVVFDVETTGLSPLSGDRIIEIAAMKIREGKIVDKFYSLVNPNRLIPHEAINIHGISNEMVADAPKAGDILPDMISFVSGGCIAGHNVAFDLKFLSYELALAGRRLNDATPVVDTLKMSRELLPYLSSHRLAYLARSLGVVVSETHRAMADVELTVQVLIRLIDMAQDQNMVDACKFVNQFSVEKPTFKLTSSSQASLF